MKKLCLNIIATVLVFTVVVLLATFDWAQNKEQVAVRDLPKIEIALNGVELDEIISNSKEIKYEGNVVTINDGNDFHRYENVELKGRGNSTWGQPKSPFQIKFDQKVDLFGMGKAKKWVLLANYFDKSNLRNDAAFYLERLLGEKYALEGRFVELYIDGEYQGVYYLAEKVEIGKARVDLKDPYGVVVELENLHADQENCYRTNDGTCLALHDAVVDANAEAAMEDFREDFDELEMVAKEGDYERVKELADVESLAIYYLLSEFTVNPDAYASSYYFYKDGEGDVIHAGPGWDFDLAMSNKAWSYGYSEEFYEPETLDALKIYTLGGEVYDEKTGEVIEVIENAVASKLMYDLLEIPEFRDEVARVYVSKVMGRKGELLEYMKEQAVRNAEAAIRDIKIRQENGEFGEGNKYEGLDAWEIYLEEVKELMNWVRRRFDWLDGYFEDELRKINLNKIA